jgi:hypothetical protein
VGLKQHAGGAKMHVAAPQFAICRVQDRIAAEAAPADAAKGSVTNKAGYTEDLERMG